MFFTSGVYAGCVTTARGKTVCDNTGSAAAVVNPSSKAVVVNPNTNTAAGYNSRTGNAAVTQNQLERCSTHSNQSWRESIH